MDLIPYESLTPPKSPSVSRPEHWLSYPSIDYVILSSGCVILSTIGYGSEPLYKGP